MQSISDFWTLITCIFPSSRNNYSVVQTESLEIVLFQHLSVPLKRTVILRGQILWPITTRIHIQVEETKKVSTIFTLYAKAKATIKRLTINPHWYRKDLLTRMIFAFHIIERNYKSNFYILFSLSITLLNKQTNSYYHICLIY